MTLLCGGVGGARMARAVLQVLDPAQLAIVVNVADDDDIYGVRVCPDLDTVIHTLAGIDGPLGWGIRNDTFHAMDRLADLGVDTTFRLGDRDLAGCLYRTNELAAGSPLSTVTAEMARRHGIACRIMPATDADVRTRVGVADGEWLSFQEYFVHRRHADRVTALEFVGAGAATAAPGVVHAIGHSDLILIAPSNPPLSIWPILAIPEIGDAVRRHSHVAAVSPLFDGAALKGPAAGVLASLGLGEGNAAVGAAYGDVITHLIVDIGDGDDLGLLDAAPFSVGAVPTLLTDPSTAADNAAAMLQSAASSPPRVRA